MSLTIVEAVRNFAHPPESSEFWFGKKWWLKKITSLLNRMNKLEPVSLWLI